MQNEHLRTAARSLVQKSSSVSQINLAEIRGRNVVKVIDDLRVACLMNGIPGGDDGLTVTELVELIFIVCWREIGQAANLR